MAALRGNCKLSVKVDDILSSGFPLEFLFEVLCQTDELYQSFRAHHGCASNPSKCEAFTPDLPMTLFEDGHSDYISLEFGVGGAGIFAGFQAVINLALERCHHPKGLG